MASHEKGAMATAIRDAKAAPGGDAAKHVVAIEDSPRWVRGTFGGRTIVDSRRAVLLFESRHLPRYYFPLEDVDEAFLRSSDHTSHCPFKGDARYWDIVVGDRVSENAGWNYPEPIEGAPDIAGLVSFYWDGLDAWYEESERVWVHPRDPYHRVDVLESERHVRVEVDGVQVAESRRPKLLFETGLPTRYYLPELDVDMDRLVADPDRHTACPYKGVATYWDVEAGDDRHEGIVWSYRVADPSVAKIAGHLAFFNERVDVWVDGELQERPHTEWSRGT